MRTLRARNVNDLYVQGLELLAEHGEQSASRAGPVIVAPWPVMSVYERPMERVLFDPVRDANPFFHLMEGLWMLAGRRDAEFLNRYVKDFGSRFAEPTIMFQKEEDRIIHDAYGHRWRHALGFDQLNVIVDRLRANHDDRQCVLQMWQADTRNVRREDGGSDRYDDLLGDWRGRPCNTHCYFRVRQEPGPGWGGGAAMDVPLISVLDMTICCRSNDVVWGAYGANAVHFSILQEYLAGRIGVAVGTMFQLSNNFHGYVEKLDKLGDPAQLPDSDWYDRSSDPVVPMPMGTDWEAWDEDLGMFMQWHDHNMDGFAPAFTNRWFVGTAAMVAVARVYWVNGDKDMAMNMVLAIEAPDWREACTAWMQRRIKS